MDLPREIKPEKVEKVPKYTFSIEAERRTLVLRTKSEEDYNKWMECFSKVQKVEVSEVKKDTNQNPRRLSMSIHRTPSRSVITSTEVDKSGQRMAVDDIFCGWVEKKGILKQKIFLVLRLHDLTLSCYKSDNLSIPITVIHCNNLKVSQGWNLEKPSLGADDPDDADLLDVCLCFLLFPPPPFPFPFPFPSPFHSFGPFPCPHPPF